MADGINDAHLLTVREAAKFLRIGRNLAYELVARGEIPSVRLGRVIRVPRTALEQWLESPQARPELEDRGVPPHAGMRNNRADSGWPPSR